MQEATNTTDQGASGIVDPLASDDGERTVSEMDDLFRQEVEDKDNENGEGYIEAILKLYVVYIDHSHVIVFLLLQIKELERT